MGNKKLIIANWKLNPSTLQEAKQLFTAVKHTAGTLRNVQTVVAPPFLYLAPLSKLVMGHRIVLGAQDAFWEPTGPHTGEVSAALLAQFKLGYVILGHSERRARGEASETVAKKVRAVLAQNLIPVVCIGERQRDSKGLYFQTIKDQLLASLDGIPKAALARTYIAYEPIWAISTTPGSVEAQPRDITEAALYIKKTLAEAYSISQHTKNVSILYGGSVTKDNVDEYVALEHIDGALVGGASLKKKAFTEIIKKVNTL